MIKFAALFVAFMAGLSGAAFANEVHTPDGYSDFRSPGPLVVERPMAVVLEQLNAFPDVFGEGNPLLELKSYLDRADRLVIDVIETGFLDDSVKGANRRFVFVETEDGKFKVWGYGYRQQCYRGGDPNEWVADACL